VYHAGFPSTMATQWSGIAWSSHLHSSTNCVASGTAEVVYKCLEDVPGTRSDGDSKEETVPTREGPQRVWSLVARPVVIIIWRLSCAPSWYFADGNCGKLADTPMGQQKSRIHSAFSAPTLTTIFSTGPRICLSRTSTFNGH
jgi:hypothetical protein